MSYVAGDPHFQGHTKTIYHESSSKAGRNSERWMHPDLVSVRFPFGEMDRAVTELGRSTGAAAVSLYSFEMKVRVTGSDVRECFFQAVSNSSWANEGYLVALDYTEDALDQLSRLSPSFGIGAIRLDAGDVHQSEALFPARRRGALDFGIIDDLLRINPGFRSFVEAVNSSMRAGRAVESDYDEVMDDERLAGWVREKGIAAGRR